jgi:hypothetical protein
MATQTNVKAEGSTFTPPRYAYGSSVNCLRFAGSSRMGFPVLGPCRCYSALPGRGSRPSRARDIIASRCSKCASPMSTLEHVALGPNHEGYHTPQRARATLKLHDHNTDVCNKPLSKRIFPNPLRCESFKDHRAPLPPTCVSRAYLKAAADA